MSPRARLGLFAVGGTALLVVLVIAFAGLPAFGHVHSVYAATVQRVVPGERHATDLVTGLNFDVRAFDTLGEEFLLFASVTGVALLLRHLRGEGDIERSGDVERHQLSQASALVRTTAPLALVVTLALAVYIVAHGQVSPGGGFQGGLILAAGPLAVMLAGRYIVARHAAPDWLLEAVESAGAGAYALIGVGGLVAGGAFMQNFLGLGEAGMLASAGTMPLNSIAVGLEVSGAFLLLWSEFLDQAVVIKGRAGE